MMTCQKCGDTNGPFAFIDEGQYKIILVCEDCEKKIKKENKKILRRKKIHEAANI